MKAKAKLFLAKLLIFFSIFFIGVGIYLVNFGSDNILHPIIDVTVINGADEDDISVTTVDTDEDNESITDNNVPEVNLPTTSKPSDNETSNSANNANNSVSSTNSGNQATDESVGSSTKPNISDSTETVVPSTIEETNANLRTQIQNTYGITVKYGTETNGYSIGGMSTIPISDSAVIQTVLVNLNMALGLYPSGFFQEVKSKGYPLTFYLIKRYSTDNVTGVTDSTYKNIVISIASDYDFADTFHHELYHYMEKYILSTGFRFTSWNTLNPVGFRYGSINSAYSYVKTYSEDAFFVNSYAMTDEYEDRASTFEYMMKRSKASCLNNGKTIWLKAKTMSEQIDYFFNTVTPYATEYWERYI